MSTEKSGFFSKVAQLVRKPLTAHASEDDVQSGPGIGASVIDDDAPNPKESLKRMLERRRHDDAVRAREFDRLRKLRARGARTQDGRPATPSSYLDTSNFTDLSERAETIKKIDEIEAQMSRQWWRGRPVRTGFSPGDATPTTESIPLGGDVPQPPTVPGALGSADSTVPNDSVAPAPDSSLLSSLNLDDLLPPPVDASSTLLQTQTVEDWASTDVLRSRQAGVASTGFASDSPSVFSSSKISAAETGADWSCAALDEAALQFANGNDVGAEAALKTALVDLDDHAPEASLLAGALFDLYRSTGQLPAFDQYAMDYVMRFGRSAPAWSNWALLAQEAAEQAPVASEAIHTWACPATVSEGVVAELVQFLRATPQPWSFDWRALRLVELGAAMGLYQVMDRLANAPARLRFEDGDQLNRWLKARTPSQRADVPQTWWFLKLAALRVQGLVDEFELAALDFCVTYEVSPPSWQAPLCQIVVAGEGGGAAAGSALAQARLRGTLSGEVDAALKTMESFISAQGVLQVDCAHLLRVDFFAAGAILNWATSLHANGVRVDLTQVHRLVGAFLQVIGIGGSARIRLRED